MHKFTSESCCHGNQGTVLVKWIYGMNAMYGNNIHSISYQQSVILKSIILMFLED